MAHFKYLLRGFDVFGVMVMFFIIIWTVNLVFRLLMTVFDVQPSSGVVIFRCYRCYMYFVV